MQSTPDFDMDAYNDFIANKIDVVHTAGWEIESDEAHPALFPHQQDIVAWAIRHGKGLIAASFGLGKTRIEIDLMRLVHKRTGKKTLIICPLGVRHQFIDADGPEMGVKIKYVRNDAEALASDTPYLLTNYERVRDGHLTPDFLEEHIAGVTMDEGNVLRSLGSQTQVTFTTVMRNIPYRWVATATPSPNNYKELIYYAQFFGVMDIGQALTRWFKRDTSKAGNLTLLPSQEKQFWLWVASWAIFVTKPSDLGYSDEGYIMPELNVVWHQVASDHQAAWDEVDSWVQRHLLRNSANSLTQAAREKRDTLEVRIDKAAEIVAEHDPDTHWILWHHLEDERRYITKKIPNAVEVFGSQKLELREQRILDFTAGKFPILATKPRIAGSGCNFQYYTHNCIFVGVRYQFDEFIQAIHRLQRFQQKHTVNVHIIFTDAETDVVQVVKKKWKQHNELVAKMGGIIRDYGLTNISLRRSLKRTMGADRQVTEGEFFTLVNNDSVEEMARLDDDSVGLIHTSIPFGNHYEYTANYNDFGHNPTDADFWKQMDYLTPNLLRVLKPGRIAAIHVKDRLLYGHQTGHGAMEISPFSDECVTHFRKHGFSYFGRITIVTDVVRENNGTYRLGWTENSKDGSKMGVGMPEYLLLFRKRQTDITRSYADEPVPKSKKDYTRAQWQIDAHSFWRSSGNRVLGPQDFEDIDIEVMAGMETGAVYRWYLEHSKKTIYDYEEHVELGERLDEAGRLPSKFMLLAPQAPNMSTGAVWSDIVYMRTLNSNQRNRRLNNHVCPLPLDIVERTLTRYSKVGDLVLDPFGGLMTVPVVAIKMKRQAYGIELSADYWKWGTKYCEDAERDRLAPTLFDLMDYEANVKKEVTA